MTAMTGYSRFSALYRNLVRREVRQRYKGSLVGLGWTLMNPIVIVVTYSLVFHYMWKVVDIPHYPLFLFTGLSVWTFFFGGAQTAASSLVANASIVKKVRFPREIIPAAAVTANAFTAGAMFVVALPLCLLISNDAPQTLVALPPLLLLLTLLTLGTGVLLASLNVYFRDVEHILAALAMPWFFLTPIFYTFSSLPGLSADGVLLDVLYYGNPITPFLSSIRDVVFAGTWPSLADWIYCALVGPAALVVGMRVFRRLEGDMAIEL